VETLGTPILWAASVALVVLLLVLDLLVFHRKAHTVGFREALGYSVFWIGVALLFNVAIFWLGGVERGLEFTTGYLIEKSLSLDNLFVFAVIFGSFSVPPQYQHKVLFWGIVGAIVMRALFVLLGVTLIRTFDWIFYVFGAILLVTAVRLYLHRHEPEHPERNPIYKVFRKVVPAVTDYRDGKFFVREGGRLLATPLAAVIVLIETTDIVFAVDSIPAVFAITRDPFIVFTSNIFAVLGLRALYFLLAGLLRRFVYMKQALSLLLGFVGAKMVLEEVWHPPIYLTLIVVAGILTGGILLSLARTKGMALRRSGRRTPPHGAGERTGEA
jgi:tellurite resistance protein TerC